MDYTPLLTQILDCLRCLSFLGGFVAGLLFFSLFAKRWL